jgi:carbon-monoxide dehydrogenase medium subunit
MKPPPFAYHRANSIPEAVRLLSQLENAKLLAGGQSLMAMLNLRYLHPDNLIDINRIPELTGISVANGTLRIGAMTRQQRIMASPEMQKVAPIFAEALALVGHRQTRNRGTIGGSLCHLDPAAELPALALLYDATVTVMGPRGERKLQMAAFIADYMTPAIEPDELVTLVEIPLWKPGHGYGFHEFARRRGDFAIAAAGCLMECASDGRVARVAIALAGIAATPLRLTAAEAALKGGMGGADAFAKASAHCAAIAAIGDVHGSAEYRKKVAAAMVRRALTDAHRRATAKNG